MNDRLIRVTEALAAGELDALALVPGANLLYLLGLSIHASERLAVAFCTTEGEVHMVLPALEEPRAAAEATAPVMFYPWTDAEGYAGALVRCLDAIDLDGVVGVEYTAMRVLELRAIEEIRAVATVNAVPLLSRLRMVKDQSELEAMRRAVEAVEAGLRAAIALITPGISEREIAAEWERAMIRAGADEIAFPTIVASGPNSANPHHTTGHRKLTPGDLVILDGGARVGNRCSDITRTVALGPIGDELRQVYQTVLQANRAGVSVVSPATTGAAIDAAARGIIEAAGYGPCFVHRTGHGLGIETHEPPYINAGETMPLPSGATFTIEPGIYLPGRGGVRIEDDVLVTDDGGESLTTFERELMEL